MSKTEILVIGGGPAGVIAALTAKKSYPKKKITLIRKEKKGVIPCGIPYIFRRLDSVDKDLMSDQPLLDNGISLVIGEVAEIKPKEKVAILTGGREEYSYEKLILAVGSSPQLIPIDGVEREGIWLIKKDFDYLKMMRKAVLSSQKIVIIGGGFIGVEMADEFSGLNNLEVSIVESRERLLAANFDPEFGRAVESRLKNKGVAIYTDSKVKEISGNGNKAQYVRLENGKELTADLVVLSIGARPNIELAQKAGIKIEPRGGIWVDEYLRTNLPDIFAVGDCAQTRDFINEKADLVMLASVATSEARIAATNLYVVKLLRENKGTYRAFSTSIGGLAIAGVGLTEQGAKAGKFDYLVGEAASLNRHPGSLPGAGEMKVKLIFSKSSEGLLLGAQVSGPESVGEMINILSLAVQQEVSLFDLSTWQIASHPLLTPAPTSYPIIAAAQNAMHKLKS